MIGSLKPAVMTPRSASDGRIYLTFTRQAPTLREAILNAIADIDRANICAQVLRVDDCNLVTQADIARKIGRTRSLVNQYVSGARGPGRFPAPVCGLSDDTPLWQWCEVAYWLRQNDMISEKAVREAQDTAMINLALDFSYQKRMNPEHFQLILDAFSKRFEKEAQPAHGAHDNAEEMVRKGTRMARDNFGRRHVLHEFQNVSHTPHGPIAGVSTLFTADGQRLSWKGEGSFEDVTSGMQFQLEDPASATRHDPAPTEPPGIAPRAS